MVSVTYATAYFCVRCPGLYTFGVPVRCVRRITTVVERAHVHGDEESVFQ